MGKLLVVNLHGLINVPRGTRETLVQLGIGKRFAAAVVGDDPVSWGSVHLCKDYVAWYPVDEKLLGALLETRGRLSSVKRLDAAAVKELGFKDHAELASKMLSQGMTLASVKGLKPFFGLSPPKGGFKRSTRRQFGEGGVLGENPKLPELVRRMI